jgi:hypothetical protein
MGVSAKVGQDHQSKLDYQTGSHKKIQAHYNEGIGR